MPVVPEYHMKGTKAMRNHVVTKTVMFALVALAGVSLSGFLLPVQQQSDQFARAGSQTCPHDDSGLTLPTGFCATAFVTPVTWWLLQTGFSTSIPGQAGTTGTTFRTRAVFSWPCKTRTALEEPMSLSVSARLCKQAGTAARESAHIREQSTLRSMIGSFDIHCQQTPSYRVAMGRPLSPDCL